MTLKVLLDKLRISSKEAIVNGDSAVVDDVKTYLHVEREVERRLQAVVSDAAENQLPQLIFIIGNVGDGKSHLLSKMRRDFPQVMSQFKVHNDATESSDVHKTYIDTLGEVMAPYADATLHDSSNQAKTIIAINLGTLANFLDQRSADFTSLQRFIDENHIMTEDGTLSDVENKHFKFVNLADYHLFTLTSTGAVSDVLVALLQKISANQENNPFYQAYKETYLDNKGAVCPIKDNYELISKKEVQRMLSNILVYSLIKDKNIVSIRHLLNFIYDILVPPQYANLSQAAMTRATSEALKKNQYHLLLLPSLLFDNNATSSLLTQLSKYDPVAHTNEALDDFITQLSRTVQPEEYFIRQKLLNRNAEVCKTLNAINVYDCAKLFIRLNYLRQSNMNFIESDKVFDEFVHILYSYYQGQKPGLKLLYSNIQAAVFQWNGTTKESGDAINVGLGRSQTAYKIMHELRLEAKPECLDASSSNVAYKFRKFVPASFKLKNDSKIFTVTVDYNLYKLAVEVSQGYRVNALDKVDHLDFSRFVEQLSNHQAANKNLTIQVYSGKIHKEYELTYESGFEAFKFEEKW